MNVARNFLAFLIPKRQNLIILEGDHMAFSPSSIIVLSLRMLVALIDEVLASHHSLLVIIRRQLMTQEIVRTTTKKHSIVSR